MVSMPALPLPVAHRHPPSPPLPSSLDGPPLIRRCLFSALLQPPTHTLPPPHHTVSFKVNSGAMSNPVTLPPRHTLSFKISDAAMLEAGKVLRMSFCFYIATDCAF